MQGSMARGDGLQRRTGGGVLNAVFMLKKRRDVFISLGGADMNFVMGVEGSLDDNVNPKIADFGLSRLMTAAANSNVIATTGALGYRALELSRLKKANTKTDVYSLGVIMLELLTGKSLGEAMNGVDLPQWVASIVKEEWTNEVFDLELMKDASAIGDELLNTLKLALHCVDPSPSTRPEVQLVLQQLEETRPETTTSSGDDGGVGPSMSE
ncbi:probable leucine-rich repeat receptor-like protein kinase IMK3 [Tanacetum coccineum]